MASNYGGYGGYTTTTFSGQGGADGGGFVNQGFASQQGSQDGVKKDHENDTVTPVTIKQILNADGPNASKFSIDGHEMVTVTFVGQVRSASAQATNTVYQLDDGTGMLEGRKWREPDSETENEFAQNSYVRVFGAIRVFNDRKTVNIMMVRPVTDMNEINMHLLEATYVHLYNTRGSAESQAANGGGNPMFVDGDGHGGGGGKSLPPMSPNASKVYSMMDRAERTNDGLNAHFIASQLGMQAHQVLEAADELLSKGLIFTTTDEETWAVLEF